MAEPLLVFEGVALRSEEGKILFDGLDWTLARGANITCAPPPGETPRPCCVWPRALPIHRQAMSFWTAFRWSLSPSTTPSCGEEPWAGSPGMGSPGEPEPPGQRRAAPDVHQKDGADRRRGPWPTRPWTGRTRPAADHRPHALEPRERWLGALVRAALMEPELWLVDHPAGALSRRLQESAAMILERGEVPRALQDWRRIPAASG